MRIHAQAHKQEERNSYDAWSAGSHQPCTGCSRSGQLAIRVVSLRIIYLISQLAYYSIIYLFIYLVGLIKQG